VNRATTLGSILFTTFLLLTSPQTLSQTSSKQVMAYYESSGSYESLVAFHGYFNQLPTDTFGVDIHGNVTGTAPSKALDFAKAKGMKTFATVSNFGAHDFDPKIAHAVLNNAKTRALVIANFLRIVHESGYSGINIDFESVEHADRKLLTSFVHDVAGKMRAAQLLTVVSVPAELKDDPQDPWTGAFDFAALGRDADILQLMTYDQHGPWGKPGPVAGLDWVEQCVHFTVSVVAPDKVSLGIPAYGYDWNTTKGTGAQVHWKDVPGLIAGSRVTRQWDAASSSPFFHYQAADGSSHLVWYEDEKSVPLKTAVAVSNHLAGISVFALGFDDLSFWQAVQAGGF
jgi:spore germination protein YaaH